MSTGRYARRIDDQIEGGTRILMVLVAMLCLAAACATLLAA